MKKYKAVLSIFIVIMAVCMITGCVVKKQHLQANGILLMAAAQYMSSMKMVQA